VRKHPLALGLLAGVVLDAAFGDPRHRHPVAAFGTAATAVEKRIYADSRPRGAAFTAACVLGAAVPAAVVARLTRRSPLAAAASAAVTTWAVTGARSLTMEAERRAAEVDANDLPAAREGLRALCARDPSGLDADEIARAVVESVAENTSDAVVAPLLWGAVAGVPGLVAYRAINTLDAMVGYRSERYRRFGWAAARLDDAANLIPARVTAALTAACAPVVGGSPRRALRAWRVYGSRHPSPNAGRCESAFAGALGVTLGGENVYHGVAEKRPTLGDGRAPDPDDIGRAVRLSRAVTWSAAALAAGLAVALAARRPTLSGRCDANRQRSRSASHRPGRP
jgi:adenosylcobinamide-phosphate synthase